MGNGSDGGRDSHGTAVEHGQSAGDTLRQSMPEIERSRELSKRRAEPPSAVPGYVFLKPLGEGAYGAVWLAREQNTGKHVAIKFYTHRRGLDWSLLNREVEKLAVLYTSRNIIGLIDVGWDSDPPHYVMEYLENGSLADFLAGGPLPAHEAVRIAKSVLTGLIHAHGSGILHCDLKPANVLLDAEFEPRLCDFGQSRLSNEQNPALGTLFYMAPEQADMKAVPDARWDVYALGALLYHMLTGEPPYRTPESEARIRAADTLEERLTRYRKILESSPPLNLRALGIDKRLAEIVEKCLQIDPHQRYPNAQSVLDVLELRDRQRARRPLLTIGIVGPAILLFGMALVVNHFSKSAVLSTQNNLVGRALESDALTARILARSVQLRLEDRLAELEQVARNPQLVAAFLEAEASGWRDRTGLENLLRPLKDADDAKRLEQSLAKDVSWFVNERNGIQRWRAGEGSGETLDRPFWSRDYFHGLNEDLDEKRPKPADLKPIQAPHISIPFISKATYRYMVAISVPIRRDPNDSESEVIGVLARTTHLGDLLSDLRQRLRAEGKLAGERRTKSFTKSHSIDRELVLVDRRTWQLIDHPFFDAQSATQSNPNLTVRMSDEMIEELTAVEAPKGSGAEPTTVEPQVSSTPKNFVESNYVDPVGQLEFRDDVLTEDASGYGGLWLAAFAPIPKAGWIAIVQERRDAALEPVNDMQKGLFRYGILALGVACALIGLLWYFVNRALNDRSLRFWSTKERTARAVAGVSARTDSGRS